MHTTRPYGSSRGQVGVREGSGRPPGGRKKIVHLVRFKIMGLSGGFSLLLKRPEMMLNEFFDDLFSESCFFRFFRVLYIRKFRTFFPMFFTIKK